MIRRRLSCFSVAVGICALFLWAGDAWTRIDDDSIVGVWLLDEEDGDQAVDSSGNERHGDYVGGPIPVDGKFGMALEFNGASDTVRVPALGQSFPSKSITIVTWAQIDELRDEDRDLFSIDPLDPKRATVLMGAVGFHWYFGDPNLMVLANFDEAWLDQWVHFAFLNNVSTNRKEEFMAIYANGVKYARAGMLAGDFGARDADFMIGGREATPFKGLIDEFAIFDVALSEEEINAVMTQGLARAALHQAVDPAGKTATSWAAIKSAM